MVRRLICVALFFGGCAIHDATAQAVADPRMEILSVRKIWDAAPHNAFTDLQRFGDQWICAFREGSGHAGKGDFGKIRVIGSADGETWESLALLETEGLDLRDAKLSVTPDGKLLLNSCEYDVGEKPVVEEVDGETTEESPESNPAESESNEEQTESQPAEERETRRRNESVTYLSTDGKNWDGPHRIADPGYWVWQTTWHDGVGYALGYAWGDEDATRLYTTKDGIDYEPFVDHLRPPGDKCNEHALVFSGDKASMFLRRDNSAGGTATAPLFGTASAPYRDWEWKRLSVNLQGPAMLELPDGRLLTCCRRKVDSTKTEIGFIDRRTGTYTSGLRLPSGGDTSYAGLVWHEGVLWISYYSSHEEKTSIYLAKVAIPPAARKRAAVADLGSRRELFVDYDLIDEISGQATLQMHSPHRANKCLSFDKPWEGVFSGYPTVIKAGNGKDGDAYHLYYRGLPKAEHSLETEVTCYATSRDGVKWEKPSLTIHATEGHAKNNVILAKHPACHNFSPFLDQNPACEPSQKFKALGGDDKHGLYAFVSADGVNWKPLRDESVFTDKVEGGWAFDSQNVCFWSTAENKYVLYYRRFEDGLRKIYKVTSDDLLDWSPPQNTYANLPGEHLYTNQTQPYFRAPHFYVAFAKRFFPGKVSVEPAVAERLVDNPDYRRDTADAVLMTSRAATVYDRTFRHSFIPPGPSPRDWISRSNAPACGVVPAPVAKKMYLYRLSHYGQESAHLTRYELRTDGFASVHVDAGEGAVTTRLFTFEGNQLRINFATGAGGSVRIELQDSDGKALEGYSLGDCDELVGDDIRRLVRWNGVPRIQVPAQPIRMRIVLNDADLYSFRFSSPKQVSED